MEGLIILFIGIWSILGLYGLGVLLDADGDRARLKEYDRRHTDISRGVNFPRRIDCREELRVLQRIIEQYAERHAEDFEQRVKDAEQHAKDVREKNETLR